MSYTVSNYILDRLKQLGLEYFFEVPGDYASIFLTTLDSYEGITRIPNINELGVGYATDGYGRFKGVAACSVQYGVGTFSVLNGFAGGYVERVPMALIAPSPSTNDRVLTRTEGILFHHSTGNLTADKTVFENVTVAAETISNPATAPSQIDRALTAMITHRRPVFIEVLQNIFGAACAQPVGELKPTPLVSEKPSLEAALESAWNRIRKARLPVLWGGVEIQRFGLQSLFQEIVDASGMLFTTTSLGKTVLDESQRQFAGTYAGPASPALTRAVMAKTDCPIALGAIITDDYLDIMAADYGDLINVNDEVCHVGYEHYQGVVLKDFMTGLLARFQTDPAFPRKYRRPGFKPDPRPRYRSGARLTYELFYYEMSNWLIGKKQIERSKLILGESTSLYVFGNLFGMPQESFVAQAAWGSLGHETGCALGVELATGHRPIVVAGDGGFMMICQEISSLVRQKSNAAIFVMSNGGYAIEQAFVDIKAFTPQGSYAPFDLLPDWDYPALAKAFGARGHIVETVGQLRSLLRKLEKQDGVPDLVQVKIPLKDLAPQLKRLATTP
ncbi:MAG: alpha-keto acid decarboxylase family protein [Lewinella sp.]|nr:alpha-keto acid decarboxylase family protein [Lewinella sp.]